jgi:hypothetical protein
MPVPSQGHYGFHSFPVVDWFCLFIYLWVLTFPVLDCSEFDNFVITLIYFNGYSNKFTLRLLLDIHIVQIKWRVGTGSWLSFGNNIACSYCKSSCHYIGSHNTQNDASVWEYRGPFTSSLILTNLSPLCLSHFRDTYPSQK